ncbi:MAG: hypothetical protein ACKO0Z_04610 [Betaproteobacteria bacterium]
MTKAVEKDTVWFEMASGRDDLVMVYDECWEEVARYRVAGDLLSHWPGLDERELMALGECIRGHARQLKAGHLYSFDLTPVHLVETH